MSCGYMMEARICHWPTYLRWHQRSRPRRPRGKILKVVLIIYWLVPNGAAGHYLLRLVYRYTGRKKAAIDHFTQALTADPLLWVAYEELCALGAAKEAKECFGDDVAPRIHQQHYSDMTSKNLNISIDKQGLPSNAETEQPLSSHYSTVTNNFMPYDTPSPTILRSPEGMRGIAGINLKFEEVLNVIGLGLDLGMLISSCSSPIGFTKVLFMPY